MDDRLSFKTCELRRFIELVQIKMGMGSDELGKLLGFSGRTIRDWKRAKYRPAKAAIFKLSEVSEVQLPEYQIIPWKEHIKQAAHLGGKRTYQLYGLLGTGRSRAKGGRMCWLKRKSQPELWNKYTNPITQPEESVDLAEFIGIMLGDGGLTAYQCTVYLNSETDQEFAKYIKALIKHLFNLTPHIHKHKTWKMLKVSISGVNLIKYLVSRGLCLGNKVHLQVGVPKWVCIKQEYIRVCIRGLVDTDGSFVLHKYRVNGKEYCYPKLCFSNRSQPLLDFVYKGLKQFGFNPKRTFKYQIWLHNQNEVREYLRVVGTRNYRPNIKRILEGDSCGKENGLLNHHD